MKPNLFTKLFTGIEHDTQDEWGNDDRVSKYSGFTTEGKEKSNETTQRPMNEDSKGNSFAERLSSLEDSKRKFQEKLSAVNDRHKI